MKKMIQFLTVAVLFAFTFNAKAQTTYTYTGSGNFNSVTSWTTTGGVNPPAMPTGSADIFQINTSTSIGATSWTVTAGSSIIIGNGVTPITFNTGTDTTEIISDSGSPDLAITVSSNATFIVLTQDFFTNYFDPAQTIFSTNSLVNYSLSNCVVGAGDYYNLTITHNASLNGNIISVANTFNNAAVLTTQLGSITFYGTVTGTGSFLGDGLSIIDVESTNPITLNFISTGKTLGTLKVGAGTVTLNTDLLVSGKFGATYFGSVLDLSGGILKLNGHILTLDTDNDATFGTGANVITGSTSSALVIKSASFNGGGSNADLNMDQTSSATNSLRSLVMNGSTFATLNLANQLNITDSICPTSGFITTSGNLTLIANQTTVGKVGRVGVVTGSISGNVTSQVFHNPTGNQTNWMLMGSAGIDSPTFTDWNSNFVITCPTCPITSVYGSTFNSVQSYDESSGTTFGDALHYNPIGGLGSTINPGQGYWVYLGTANPGTSIPGELISVTGDIKFGAINVNLTNHNTSNLTDYGYNLIANPYPSTISWKKVMALNSLGSSATENTYYAYSASYNGGDYMAYNAAGGGASNPPSGTYTIGNIIPAGLGFYVQTDQSTRTLSFDEKVKVNNTSNPILYKESQQNNSTESASTPQSNNFSLQVLGASNESWATVTFNTGASAGYDGYDAMAMGYNNLLQISTSTSSVPDKSFAINGLPELNQNFAIPVKILSGTTAQYHINPYNLQNMLLGACLSLHDNYTGTDYDLRNGGFDVTINDTETVARFVLNVTVNQLAITTNLNQATCSANNDGLITAIGNSAGPWNYIWRDAQGNIVKTSLNKTSSDTLSGLNNGVYSVEVNTQGSCDAAVQSFTVTAPGAATSLFSVPMQVNAGSTITFTNSSTDATTYAWSFGDGNSANQANPSYVYNNAGTYTVTLIASNTVCNETSASSQVIVVDATTGIKQSVAGSGDIFVSKDATGNYIQFNYAAQTKVNITVYNVLGQTILSNAGLNVVTDKIYLNLNLNDSKNQVLYVTVTDLTTNIQTTKKFVNN